MTTNVVLTFVLLGIVAWAACPAVSAQQQPRDIRIVFIGDSNTRGTPHTAHGTPEFPGDPNPIAEPFTDGPYGGGPGGRSAYVNLLRQRLGKGFELFNRGRGGTAASVWADDEQGILTEVEKLDPDYVVLYVGLSGVVLKEKQSDFERAMPLLIKKVQAWPDVRRVFVVNVPPVASQDMAPVIKSYNQWLANLQEVTLVDVHSTLADERGVIKRKYVDHPDLYHQNYNGHYQVAQLLFDAFLDAGVLAPRHSR